MSPFRTIGEVMLDGRRVLVQAGRYRHGGQVAIVLTDARTFEPVATFSTNLAAHGANVRRDAFAVKAWSENAALVEPLRASGLFRDTGERIASGFVEASVWSIKDPARIPPPPRERGKLRDRDRL